MTVVAPLCPLSVFEKMKYQCFRAHILGSDSEPEPITLSWPIFLSGYSLSDTLTFEWSDSIRVHNIIMHEFMAQRTKTILHDKNHLFYLLYFLFWVSDAEIRAVTLRIYDFGRIRRRLWNLYPDTRFLCVTGSSSISKAHRPSMSSLPFPA